MFYSFLKSMKPYQIIIFKTTQIYYLRSIMVFI